VRPRSPRLHGYPPRSFQRSWGAGEGCPTPAPAPRSIVSAQMSYRILSKSTKAPQNVCKTGTPSALALCRQLFQLPYVWRATKCTAPLLPLSTARALPLPPPSPSAISAAAAAFAAPIPPPSYSVIPICRSATAFIALYWFGPRLVGVLAFSGNLCASTGLAPGGIAAHVAQREPAPGSPGSGLRPGTSAWRTTGGRCPAQLIVGDAA
jgi:hypothetical protein